MGSSMVTEVVSPKDDTLCMPPPRKILRRGTQELNEAMRNGEIKLSIPFDSGGEHFLIEQAWEEELAHVDSTRATSSKHVSISPKEDTKTKCNDFSAGTAGDGDVNICPSTTTLGKSYTTGQEEEQEGSSDEEKSAASGETKMSPRESDNNKNHDSCHPNSTKEKGKSKMNVSTRFSDVIGHSAVKLRLDEVLLPLALPRDLADSILTGIRSLSASILMFGPPGCGKTQLAKAIAGEAAAAFISVGPSDILSKYVGESESAISTLFQKAYKKAQEMESKTAVLFFDEIDALGQSRGGSNSSPQELPGNSDGCSRRVLAELLIQLNFVNNKSTGCNSEHRGIAGLDDDECETRSIDSAGYEGEDEMNSTLLGSRENMTSLAAPDPEEHVRVIVVAATNRPDDCDPALVRRFAVRVLVGLPSQRDRKKILKQYLAGIDHTLSLEELNTVALATDGWSGSDIESLTREAAMAPIRECLRSAALLKRRGAPRQEQCSGDSSYQVGKGDREDPHEASKQKLLAQFRNLRPVSAQDFESALAFWSCNQRATTSSSFGPPGDVQNDALSRGITHYDSSSDEEA